MKKSKEEEILSDYNRIVNSKDQPHYIQTEWRKKNGVFTKFSMYSDSCSTISTTSASNKVLI